MKYSFVFLFLFTLSISTAFAKDECRASVKEAGSALKEIRKAMKEKIDIDVMLGDLEERLMEDPCLSFKKLNLSDNEMAGFRKYNYAPDRSFNLDEKSCVESKVDTSNMPKNNNQGPLGWCYAFTSADLLSFHEKKTFSAYDIALQTTTVVNDIKKETHTQYNKIGGNPSAALDIALFLNQQKGLCLESDFSNAGIDWLKLSEMVYNLASSDKKISQIVCENQFNEQKILQDIPDGILKILDKLTAGKRTAALFDIKCVKRHVLKTEMLAKEISVLESKGKSSKEDIILKLDEVLNRGEPFSIGYDSDVLEKGEHYSGDPGHASTVVGRRFNKRSGQCEYEIKNSWGDDAEDVPGSIGFKKGNYWVPRTALKNNVDSGWWIEKP